MGQIIDTYGPVLEAGGLPWWESMLLWDSLGGIAPGAIQPPPEFSFYHNEAGGCFVMGGGDDGRFKTGGWTILPASMNGASWVVTIE